MRDDRVSLQRLSVLTGRPRTAPLIVVAKEGDNGVPPSTLTS